MTDADWRKGRTRDELLAMLQYVQSNWDDWDERRGWLFGAAVLRRIWDLLTDPRFRDLVEAAEGWATGRLFGVELQRRIEVLPTLPPAVEPAADPPAWTTGSTIIRIGGGSSAPRPTGVLNFHELPLWAQQTHHAIYHVARGQGMALCIACTAVRADYAAEMVPEHGPLTDWQGEFQQAEARLRREEADARHRGISDSSQVKAFRRRVAEMREQSSWLASQYQAARERTADATRTAEFAAQADLLRCVAGNPFAAVAVDEKWGGETVLTLARGIVADRAFDRMPILADALEEAACDHPDVLAHCRTPGPHALGCWVLAGLLAISDT